MDKSEKGFEVLKMIQSYTFSLLQSLTPTMFEIPVRLCIYTTQKSIKLANKFIYVHINIHIHIHMCLDKFSVIQL